MPMKRPAADRPRERAMIDKAIRRRVLEQYPMLKSLPAVDLDRLLASAAYVKAPAGAAMFDEGEACQGFPLLLSGVARIVKAAPNGRELHRVRRSDRWLRVRQQRCSHRLLDLRQQTKSQCHWVARFCLPAPLLCR